MPPPRPRQLALFSVWVSDAESQDLVILQLNVEGLTLPKLDVLEHLTSTTKANVVLLQETHKENNTILKLPDFPPADHTNSKHHGLVTFVKNDIKWALTEESPEDAAVEWLTITIHDTTIVNIYKHPPIRFEQSSLPDAPAPAIYAGDFNMSYTDGGYKSCNQDGEFLVDWASASDATLLFDSKKPTTFISGRWKMETTPDLAFANVRSQEPLPMRHVLDCFPHALHRPSLITTSSLIQPTSRKPVCRWNFRKATWLEFEREVDVTAGPSGHHC